MAIEREPVRSKSYSADVRLYLILESGERVPLARTSPDYVDLCEPREIPPGKAVIEIRVDDNISRDEVWISQVVGRRVSIRIA